MVFTHGEKVVGWGTHTKDSGREGILKGKVDIRTLLEHIMMANGSVAKCMGKE